MIDVKDLHEKINVKCHLEAKEVIVVNLIASVVTKDSEVETT